MGRKTRPVEEKQEREGKGRERKSKGRNSGIFGVNRASRILILLVVFTENCLLFITVFL